MQINLEIPNEILSEEEKSKLKNILNLEDDNEFKGIILSAFQEYKDMLLGNGVPTRAEEIKQYRLLYLIKNYFDGRIPNEFEVSRMFQLTETESRSLIKNVRTRFKYKLEKEILNTLRDVMKKCEKKDDCYQVIIQSDNALEELNRILSEKNAFLQPIRKVSGSSRCYNIKFDTYDELNKYLEK